MHLKADASGRRLVRCPTCGGPSVYAEDNPYRPFCSERCRNHDLGAWASENYRVPAASSGEHEDPADDAASPAH